MNTIITLNSFDSINFFPNNQRNNFVNKLPSSLVAPTGKKFYLKLRAIALSAELTSEDIYAGYVKVHISELTEQQSGTDFNYVLCGFSYPPKVKFGDVGFHTVDNGPSLPVRVNPLTKLHVKITNSNGEELALTPASPTVIILEISNINMDTNFTITCTSYHPDLYPGNTLSLFSSPLPSEMNLQEYEVALQNIVFPPQMTESQIASLSIEGIDYNFNLSNYVTTMEFLEDVALTINASQFSGIILLGRNSNEESPHFGHIVIKRTNQGDQEMYKIDVSWEFTLACGQTDKPRGTTWLRKGEMIVFDGWPDINLAKPNPLVMIHCNIIEPNIVGSSLANLLQIVPIQYEGDNSGNQMYEPHQLLFHPVMKRPFDGISFNFKNPDGRGRNFECGIIDQARMIITLVFRPKTNMI